MNLPIGSNIKRLRRKNDMTQEQLAVRLGVTFQSVSRWENGQVYPDMELMPAIAEIFGASVDSLMGVPESEKEKRATALVLEFVRLCRERDPDKNAEKMTELLRIIRRNYADCEAFYHIWTDVDLSQLSFEPILNELRHTVEARLKKCPGDELSIKYFSKIEDDGRVGEFIESYTAPAGLGRDELLFERYWVRGEHDKYELTRQLRLFETVNELTAGASVKLWGRDESKSCEQRFRENTARLQILHTFCREAPTEVQPVSCGKEIDMWAGTRISLGLRQAECLVELGRRNEAYIFLEDAVSLLERVMKITDKITLEPEEFLHGLIWTAEESWHSPDNDPTGEEHRMIFIANESDNVTRCVCVYPSNILFYMTSYYKGFDNIKNGQKFKELVDRVRGLIVTRPILFTQTP